MGVLVDYFTADSDTSAERALGGGPADAGLPTVDCKGWIDDLSDLAAELSGRDTSEFRDAEVVVDDSPAGARDVSLVVRLTRHRGRRRPEISSSTRRRAS